jgi:alpha-tubulin suppressor-like RCC1 family protein
MNLKRARSLVLSALPISLPLFAACGAPADVSTEEVGDTAQAVTTASGNSLAGGNAGSLVLKSDGTVWSVGDNTYGELGDGTTTSRTTLGQITSLSGITAVAEGEGVNATQSLALKADGTVWAWGPNAWGELGDGTSTERATPVEVLSGVKSVAAAYIKTIALKWDGTVWEWGFGFGATPVQVSGLSGITAVAGGKAAYALRSDGTLWAWGSNSSGELGDGTTTAETTPAQVHGPNGTGFLTGVKAVAGGRAYALALMVDGTVMAWGANGVGQLGDGTTTQRLTPAPVSGLSGVIAVVAGYEHSLALKSDGTLWAWGWNAGGQLGDGTTGGPDNTESTPVQVHGPNDTGLLTGVVAVAAGELHSLAQTSDGNVWAWGDNTHGQLGDGTTTQRTTPVQMSFP